MQRTSSASISRPGIESARASVGEHQVVVALVAVGLLGPGSTLIMPRHTVRDLSCRAAL